MKDLLIGLDAGTSVIKAVAFDMSGHQVGMASRRNSYATLPDGGTEQDMARTWRDAAAVLKDLCDTVPDLGNRAVALGVTGQGDGTWLVDKAGKPVHDGWLWTDPRAGPQARALLGTEAERTAYRITGTGLNLSQMRTQMLWMEANAPELLQRASAAFHCKDWLYLQLTGECVTDPSEALFTWGDFRSRTYSDEVAKAMGLGAYTHLLPPIVDGAEVTHPLSAEAAAQTGLPEGLPISLGYLDVMCCAMAAGLYDPDAMPGLTILGSTGVHMRFAQTADTVQLNDACSGYTLAFPGHAFAQMQTNMAATLNIDWILGLAVQMLESQGVQKTQADLLDGLDAQVMQARPGAALYHPYILQAGERGPFAEPHARASFTGLDQSAGWFDMVRAVFDGLALAARDCYTAMGPIPNEIRITGGAARSEALRVILASALNRPVRTVSRDEAGAAGAAMVAACAQGVFDDIGAAAQAWVNPLLRDPVAPDPALVPVYDQLFDAYLSTRKTLAPVWDVHANMREALS